MHNYILLGHRVDNVDAFVETCFEKSTRKFCNMYC